MESPFKLYENLHLYSNVSLQSLYLGTLEFKVQVKKLRFLLLRIHSYNSKGNQPKEHNI
jgi:hypothetical protein